MVIYGVTTSLGESDFNKTIAVFNILRVGQENTIKLFDFFWDNYIFSLFSPQKIAKKKITCCQQWIVKFPFQDI